MYIGNVFKNHITVIEKKKIAIHTDIELMSSPTFHLFFHDSTRFLNVDCSLGSSRYYLIQAPWLIL